MRKKLLPHFLLYFD